MFLLDTNVVSELRRSDRANPLVLAWSNALPSSQSFISAITILELETGILLRERRDPRQGAQFRTWFENKVLPSFTGRVLPVDSVVARRCASLHVPNRRPDRDAFIAATAIVHGLTVATRNICDFEPMGVALFNPWQPVEP
jgi:predicted nucleic acid-binding protein